MKLQTYAAFSFLATIVAVYHAFSSRGQFYPAMVHLSTSKLCKVLLLNMGLVVMCMTWQLVKHLFLGSLREAEVERLNEQSWREVMEILFAITIFRQDFSVMFFAMVTALLLIKALHWLAQKRVEYIETTPTVPKLSHIRIVSFMGFLLLVDCLFLFSSLKSLVQTWEASVFLFFAFEYTILATTTVSAIVKYVFYVSDMLMEGQWEKKAVYTFYLDLVRDLLHLSIYIVFFLVIFASYGVPLHLIRELYETFRSFRMRVSDYIRYRKITSNMNERFPDATPEELNVSDATCIICREEMIVAKKLRCGHLFHVHCLKSWLERQHTCPTCRALVAPPENGSAAVGSQQPVPSEHQSGPAVPGPAASDTGVLNQNQSVLQVAAAAAEVYEKSFVHLPTNHYIIPQGYPLPPQFPKTGQSNGGMQDRPFSSQENLMPFQVPGSNPNVQGSLKVEKLIRNQIELLQAQLEALEQLMAEQSKEKTTPSSKEKTASSSSSNAPDDAGTD